MGDDDDDDDDDTVNELLNKYNTKNNCYSLRWHFLADENAIIVISLYCPADS